MAGLGVTRNEVAVIVLGYLEREGFASAATAFARESIHLRSQVCVPPNEQPVDLVRLIDTYDRMQRQPAAAAAATASGTGVITARMYDALQGITADYEAMHGRRSDASGISSSSSSRSRSSGAAASASTAASHGGVRRERSSSFGAAVHASPSRRKPQRPRRRTHATNLNQRDVEASDAFLAAEEPFAEDSIMYDGGGLDDIGDNNDGLNQLLGLLGSDSLGGDESLMPFAEQLAGHINRTMAVPQPHPHPQPMLTAMQPQPPPQQQHIVPQPQPQPRSQRRSPASPIAKSRNSGSSTSVFGTVAVTADNIISDPALNPAFTSLIRGAPSSPARRTAPPPSASAPATRRVSAAVAAASFSQREQELPAPPPAAAAVSHHHHYHHHKKRSPTHRSSAGSPVTKTARVEGGGGAPSASASLASTSAAAATTTSSRLLANVDAFLDNIHTTPERPQKSTTTTTTSTTSSTDDAARKLLQVANVEAFLDQLDYADGVGG